MQKTDLELRSVILQAMDDAAKNWINGYDNEAVSELLETITENGYKIVKDDE